MPFTKLNQNDRRTILQTARHAIQYGLTYSKAPVLELSDFREPLRQPGSSFVTLKETGVLRGCIGGLEATGPLIQDVADHAFAAAFRDPRFPPINAIEEPMVHISVALLSKPEPVTANNENELCTSLSPGEDGLTITLGDKRATYLPSVWEQLPQPREFVQKLKQKAGIAPDFWDPELKFYRYSALTID